MAGNDIEVELHTIESKTLTKTITINDIKDNHLEFTTTYPLGIIEGDIKLIFVKKYYIYEPKDVNFIHEVKDGIMHKKQYMKIHSNNGRSRKSNTLNGINMIVVDKKSLQSITVPFDINIGN